MPVASELQQSGTSRDQVVSAFVAAWNTADEAERRRLLERCWAEDGRFVHDSGVSEGRESLLAAMGPFIGRWPAGAKVRISPIEEHHGWLRYSWTIFRPEGSPHAQGMQVAERAADGRLQLMINFAGRPPEVGS